MPLEHSRARPGLSWRDWARRAVYWAGAVLVSVVAVGFARGAVAADGAFHALVTRHPLAALAVTPAGLVLAAWLTQVAVPGAQGSGIPQVIASISMSDPGLVRRLLSLRVAAGKIVLTLLGLASGASIGREGPTVQVAATIMRVFGERFARYGVLEQRGLVLAGGAAGIAAAFNTPLAGIVFGIEELSRSFDQRSSGVVLTTVVIAGIVTIAFTGNGTYFGVTPVDLKLGVAWIAVPVCGVLGGLAGGAFSLALVRASAGLPGAVGRAIGRFPVIFALLCGLAIAGLGLLSHGLTYGTGYSEARELLAGRPLPPLFCVYKLLATVVSYASGIPGGIFAPSLSVGAGLGQWLSGLLPAAPQAAVVLLGMVAYFAGVVQAPITAAVIVLEMAGNETMTIPLMAAAFIAYGASRLVCPRALYGALAEDFIARTKGAAGEVPADPPVAAKEG
jgi:H+/Cl- antiporter ClcA